MRRQGRPRFVATIVSVLIAIGAIAGCQVSTDDEPAAVGPIFNDLLETTTTSSAVSAPDGATRPVTVYFLRSEQSSDRLLLFPVQRSVAIDAGPTQILTNLFDQRPDGTERVGEAGLSSAIPETATLLSAQVTPGTSTLVVDTEGLFGAQGPVGPASRDAAAQIVYTATELDNVNEVRFLSNGEAIGVLIGSGETAEERAVNRNDYANLTS